MSSPRLPSVKLIIKFCGVVAAIAAVAFAQLGPSNWQFRKGLGWQTEHVLAYFVVTSIVCLAWPRPFVVGPAMMAAAILLEALQALTPDRSANFLAGLCGAGGALLLTLGYQKRSQLFVIVLSLSLYAAILEIVQIWVPRRHPAVIDFAASSAGALIGAALVWIGLRATKSWLAKRPP